MTKKLSLWAMTVWAMCGAGTSAWAIFPTYLPTGLASVGATQVSDMLSFIALAAGERPLTGASALGTTLGLELGVGVTGVIVPSSFQSALTLATGGSTQVPSTLLIPKLVLRKGLPWGIDLGASGFYYPLSGGQNLVLVGGHAKWTFFSPPALPNLAVLGSVNYASMWFISAMTYTVDAVVSYPLVILEPYGGGGMRIWNGSLGGAGLPAAVSASAAGISAHFYAGLALKLAIIKLVAEYDYSTPSLSTIGGKVALAF